MSARGHAGLLLGGSANFAAYMASLAPVAWWRMDDPVGSTQLSDSIANEKLVLSGTYTLESPGLVAGDNDKAVAFNGSSGMANSAASAKWALGTGDFSVFLIAKWTGTSLTCISTIRDSGPTNILALFTANRNAVGDVGCEGWNWNSQKITVPGPFNDGTRHVLAQTYKASTNELRFYVDGVLKGTQVQAGSNSRPTASTMTVRAANNFASQYMPGTMDEIALFSRLLSDAEMAGLASRALNG